MLKTFWEKESVLIGFSLATATIGALFLNVQAPKDNVNAATALATIQVFWLVLLTLNLTILFFRFLALVVKEERSTQRKYDLPSIGAFSLTLGSIFLIVIVNFWEYIFSIYNTSISSFLGMIFPALISTGSFALMLYIEKHPNKFTRFSYIVVLSFIVSTYITLFGMFIQGAILGYFYLYWPRFVYPGVFVTFTLLLIVVSIIKKKSLVELRPLKIKVKN